MIITTTLLVLAWLMAGLNLRFFWENRKGPRYVSTAPVVAQVLVAFAWLAHERTTGIGWSPWLFIVTALADVSLWQLLHGLWRLAAGRNA